MTLNDFLRRRSLAASALVALGLLWPSSASAQVVPAAVRFSDTSAVELDDDPVSVVLVNDSDATWTLDVSATLTTVDGQAASDTVPVMGAPAALPPAKSVTFTVGPPTVDADTAQGYVVAVARNGPEVVVARQPLSMAAPTAVPGVTSWSGSNQHDVTAIPLAAGDCGAVGSGRVYLRSNEQIAPMSYECQSVGGVASIVLDPGKIDEIGEYKGTLSVGDTEIDLTFLQTSAPFWPLAALVVGLLLYAAEQAWANNLRPIRRAINRLTGIGNRAMSQQKRFEDAAGSAAWRAYSFRVGVLAEVATLQTQLRDLRPGGRQLLGLLWPWPATETETRQGEILDAAADLDATVGAWPQLANHLEELRAAVRDISDRQRPLKELAPGLAVRAQALLVPDVAAGTELPVGANTAKALLDEVPATTAAVRLVPVANELGEQLDAVDPADYDDYDYSDRDVALEAKRLHRQATAELAVAKDAAAVRNAEVSELLASARALFLQLPPQERTIDVQAATAMAEGAPVPAWFGLVGVLPRWLGRVAQAVVSVRMVDVFWLVLAMAIAVWSGLEALYFDKPWGGWKDGIAMIVWAFAASAAVTSFLSALERVGAGDVPLPTNADKPAATRGAE